MANLVTTAQRQLATGGRLAITGTSRTSITLSSSARRRARRSATASRRSTAPTSSGASGSRRCHDGLYGEQDARINIEQRRDERRAARMGEGASSSRVPRSSSRGGPPPTLTPGGIGCRAFVASLRNVRWPLKIRPNLTEKYDGSINPSEFLPIYTTIILAAGGRRSGHGELFPHGSQGSGARLVDDPAPRLHPLLGGPVPAVRHELPGHIPSPRRRSGPARYAAEGRRVPPLNGVRHNRMLEKIVSKEPKTTAELFELADKVARKEEAWAWNSPGTGAAAAATPEFVPRSKRRDRRGKRKLACSDDEGLVLAADGPSRAPLKGKATGDKPSSTAPSGEGRSADKWCSVHNTYRHNLADCRSVKNLAERFRKADEEKRQGRREGKAPATPADDRRGEAVKKAPADDGDNSEDLEFQIPQGTVATLDGGGGLALTPPAEALSIISPAAFDALKAPGMKLQPSLPIIGVTPGHTWPLGHVELPVTFGDSTNFCTERINFDVADLNLPYNAVLGRPALVKFMAATHYAYLQMKMPGPSGPITVFGDVKVALACAEQRAYNLAVATEPQAPEASASRASKKRLTSADKVPVKEIPLGDDSSKTAKIGGILDTK
uniref:OSJNBa0086B14.14 protein n=1 Tax=Oryza sativa subsp. japonica TaxID=39947 RepID=Q7XV41_ORYSJ|nr:OSJNBa0086B14.14 [Oryza sativa Japonica Group]